MFEFINNQSIDFSLGILGLVYSLYAAAATLSISRKAARGEKAAFDEALSVFADQIKSLYVKKKIQFITDQNKDELQ